MSKLVHTVFLPENWDQPPSEEADGTILDKGGSGADAGLSLSFPLSEHMGVSLRNLLNMIYTYGPLLNRAICKLRSLKSTRTDFRSYCRGEIRPPSRSQGHYVLKSEHFLFAEPNCV